MANLSVRAFLNAALIWLCFGCDARPEADMRPGSEWRHELDPDWVTALEGETPLAELTSVTVRGSQVLITDQKTGAVQLHDLNGDLIRRIGEKGDGPGEYRQPLDAEFVNGLVVVADFGNPNLLVFDTLGVFLGQEWAGDIFAFQVEHLVGDRVAVGTRASASAEVHVLDLATGESSVLDYAWPQHIAEAPLARSVARDVIAAFGGWVVAVNSMSYPLHAYDPDRPDGAVEFGQAPPSFQPLPDVPADALQAGTREALAEWLPRLTIVERVLPIGDSLLAVVHGRFNRPGASQFADLFSTSSYAVDLYGSDLALVAADLPVSGKVVAAHDGHLILAQEPERSGESFALRRMRLMKSDRTE